MLIKHQYYKLSLYIGQHILSLIKIKFDKINKTWLDLINSERKPTMQDLKVILTFLGTVLLTGSVATAAEESRYPIFCLLLTLVCFYGGAALTIRAIIKTADSTW